MKYFYDKHVGEAPTFEIGDKVWLEAKNVQQRRPSKKLSHKRLGPFKILAKIGDLNYKLDLPHQMKIHPVFHVNLLTKHGVTTDIPDREVPQPPPIEIEPQIFEYEVEKILDSRMYRRRLEYLIKWKGYSDADNTWEPEKHVENAKQEVREFHQKNPGAPRKMNATFFSAAQFVPYENCTEAKKPSKSWDWDV
jgi:hypothetical protein